MKRFNWLCHVLSGLVMGLLLGCTATSPAPQAAASHPVVPPTPRIAPSPTATLKVIESPTWTLYQEPHHYFFLEYPSDWHVDPGEPPLGTGPIWSFFGLLATSTVTHEIEIGRDSIPIHSSQTMEAWKALKGPGELEKAIVEQRTFQLNGREVYYEKTSVVPQGAAHTIYFRCGTWVWFIWSRVDERAAPSEFDAIYDHVVNTFTPKCY